MHRCTHSVIRNACIRIYYENIQIENKIIGTPVKHYATSHTCTTGAPPGIEAFHFEVVKVLVSQ